MEPLECVAFMLVTDGSVLAERRSLGKSLLPGAIAIPGGHLNPGEDPEDGVRREMLEELNLEAVSMRRVCTLMHQAEELRRLHYFLVESWSGEIMAREADELLWIPLEEIGELDPVDQQAIRGLDRLRSEVREVEY